MKRCLVLIVLLLVACTPPLLPGETPTPIYEPTIIPPTEAPAATSTIVTPDPFYATQQAAQQATIVARATASPFPTAEPPLIQSGQPASAIVYRDGVSIEVRLPNDTYLAGEGGRAEITLRNEGPQTVFIHGDGQHPAWSELLDEQHHEPTPWPWAPLVLIGGPPYLNQLAPGNVITTTLPFQIPPVEQVGNHHYELWVATRFSRPSPESPDPHGPDNIWLRLEAGPIPLIVTPPTPSQQLMANLQIDRAGWQLSALTSDGRVPIGPMWGMMEAASTGPTSEGATSGPLPESSDGVWSRGWPEGLFSADTKLMMRAWVAAPGYVTAAVTQTLPGKDEVLPMEWQPPAPQVFADLDAAQAALDFPLYHLTQLPDSTALEKVQVVSSTDQDAWWATVTQLYHLPSATWLELAQMATNQSYESAGWGQARYDSEAQQVIVNENAGYVTRHFGWWILDWKVGRTGFELRAPVAAVSLEDLLKIAGRLQPLN
jgi:hypothetical protein